MKQKGTTIVVYLCSNQLLKPGEKENSKIFGNLEVHGKTFEDSDTNTPATSYCSSDLRRLPVPLLDTGFGNLQASVDNTQSCKSCLLQVRSVVVIRHLHSEINRVNIKLGKTENGRA